MSTRELQVFETSSDERLVILAGRDELDYRTIFSDHVDGRFAVVPVTDLEHVDADELRVEELQVLGETATIPETGAHEVTLSIDDCELARRDARGVYGLLWIPID